MATYTHPVTGEAREYIPYDELSDEQKKKVNSERWDDRKLATEKRLGLDKLVDDPDWSVRKAVAAQGFGLERLVADECAYVRKAVARQGYGLDKLIDDPIEFIRSIALRTLNEALGLESIVRSWATRFPERCALPENKGQ